MKKILWSIAIVMFLFTTGCGKQMPSDVITPDKMEEILYDYHLSISMSNGLKSDDNYKKVSYKNYVFQKHQITQADFDSSMVWYTRNTTKLAEIYSNLSERFKKEKNQLNMFLEARNSDDNAFASGDTVDIWPYGELYWMCKKPLNNQLTFEILPDTTFHYKDAILWKANFNFLSEGQAVMGLNIHYDNDSILGKNHILTQTGEEEIYLHTDSSYQIKSINGFIYVMGDSIQNPQVLIDNIALTRYHHTSDTIQVANSNKSNPLIRRSLEKRDL